MNQKFCGVKVLSTGYEILYSTSWQEAVKDVYCGRLEVVEEHPARKIGLVEGNMPMPTIVRFKKGVFLGAIKHPIKTRKPNRKNIFIRDDGKCQYCNKTLTYNKSTVDHVVPKSKAGRDTWENLVLCCTHCNTKKGNRTPSEAGLSLRALPRKPPVHDDNYEHGGGLYESTTRFL